MTKVFKDESIVEEDVVLTWDGVKQEVMFSITVVSDHSCVEVLLGKDELLNAVDLIRKEEADE
jgi:hypothetical protein